MKVYIQSDKNGIPHNYNFMNAYQGFREMGFETVMFSDSKTLLQSSPEDVVVGYVNTVRSRLCNFGVQVPEMDYPAELTKYLGRKVWTAKLLDIANCPET